MSAIPSHALVNFSRLMRSCDALAADLREEAARLRLAAYVPVLHSLFAQLEQEGCCAWDELDEYSRKVTRLAELLDEKRLTSGGGALAVARATSNPRLTRKQANAELSGRRTAANRVREALRAQLLHNDGAECVAEPELPPITCGEGTGFSSASPLLGPPILPAHTATVLASAASGASALDALLARAAIERPAAGADDGERQNGPAFDQNEGHTCSFSATATNDAAAAGAGGLCGSTDSAPRNAHSRSAAGAAGASKSVRFQPKEGRGAVRDSRGSCRGGESIAAASVEATLEAERNMQVRFNILTDMPLFFSGAVSLKLATCQSPRFVFGSDYNMRIAWPSAHPS
eukprot:scaffold54379_cov33-Tisochrysis_lutea.AAC.3